jgi:hypothetical protein
MSALTSSLQVLEQQLSSLNTTSAGLSTMISTAFGTEQANREDQVAAAITSLFQVSADSAESCVNQYFFCSCVDKPAGHWHDNMAWHNAGYLLMYHQFAITECFGMTNVLLDFRTRF